MAPAILKARRARPQRQEAIYPRPPPFVKDFGSLGALPGPEAAARLAAAKRGARHSLGTKFSRPVALAAASLPRRRILPLPWKPAAFLFSRMPAAFSLAGGLPALASP
jgi:hypothetical protein